MDNCDDSSLKHADESNNCEHRHSENNDKSNDQTKNLSHLKASTGGTRQKTVAEMLKCIIFDLDPNTLTINKPQTSSTFDSSEIYQKRKEIATIMNEVYETHNKSLESTSRLCQLSRECAKTNDQSQVIEMESVQHESIEETKKEIELATQAITMVHDLRALLKRLEEKSDRSGSKSRSNLNDYIKKIPSVSATIPLYIARAGERAPPLCGAMPCEADYVAQPGDYLAVDGSEIDPIAYTDWILAEVIRYDAATETYEVDDVGEEENKRYLLHRKHTAPLPKWRANPKTNPEAIYPRNTLVRAMYPTSTCFYKGIIKDLPSEAKYPYLISFYDANHPGFYSGSMPVPQQLVIPRFDKV